MTLILLAAFVIFYFIGYPVGGLITRNKQQQYQFLPVREKLIINIGLAIVALPIVMFLFYVWAGYGIGSGGSIGNLKGFNLFFYLCVPFLLGMTVASFKAGLVSLLNKYEDVMSIRRNKDRH
jgi:hypothetical protein